VFDATRRKHEFEAQRFGFLVWSIVLDSEKYLEYVHGRDEQDTEYHNHYSLRILENQRFSMNFHLFWPK
jgi:hypothetical protein